MEEVPISPVVWLTMSVWSSVLLAVGIWYFRPGASRALLPAGRSRLVPWKGNEVVLALLLVLFFWRAVVLDLLNRSGAFSLVAGTLPAEVLGMLAASPDAVFPANLPWPAMARSTESLSIQADRRSLWGAVLAFPFQVATILLVLRTMSGTRPYQLGLTWHRAGRNVLAGFLAWLLFTPFVLVLHAFITWAYQTWAHVPPEQHPLTRLSQGQPFPGQAVLVVLSAVVVAPVLEELLFRGLLQAWLARRSWGGHAAMAAALGVAFLFRWGKDAGEWAGAGFVGMIHELSPSLFVVAMIGLYLLVGPLRRSPTAGAVYGTALLFAASHAPVWPTPIPLFVLGLVLGLLAYRTQSLVAPMALHALFNGFMCALLFLSQGAAAPGVVKGSEATVAARRPDSVSTSTAVPGSWLPRRR